MPVIRLTGVCESLAVVGLPLPWATGVTPVLTPIAAVGLCVVMGVAAVVYTRRREPRTVAITLVLLAASAAVAIGRFSDLS
jgi:DoxX-like protein